MKFFTTSQQHFALMGISYDQSHQTYPFNVHNGTVLIILGLATISTTVFFFREPHSLKVYSESIYLICTLIISGINFTILIFKMQKCFEFIENFVCAIEKRKY